MYCLGTDLLDEGVDGVLRNLGDRGQVDGVAVAVRYHAARDIFPHNPRRKVASVPAAAYYRARPGAAEPTDLAPAVSPLLAGRDLLAEVCDQAPRHDLAASAWVVYLHNDVTAAGHRCVQRNCWGDGAAGILCPANPDVRRHVRSVTADVCDYSIEALHAESLHYHELEHGYHHERSMERYGPLTSWLLSLCFCEHCLAAADRHGIAGRQLKARVRDWTADSLANGRPDAEMSLESLDEIAEQELRGYVQMRQEIVTSLVQHAAEIAEARDVRFCFIEQSVASTAYLSGKFTGPPGVARSWRAGVDVGQIARTGTIVELTGYVSEPHRFQDEISGYRQAVAERDRLAVITRPGPPDCKSAKDLETKVERAAAEACEEINFYCYGLYRLAALDSIRHAVAALRGRSRRGRPGS